MEFITNKLVFLVVCVVTGIKSAQGNIPESEAGSRDLRRFALPNDAEVLLHAQTTCKKPPIELRAAFALRCGMTSKCRGCMGVSESVPIYVSGQCKGKECTMHLSPGPPSCMLAAISVDHDEKNSTRKATCGIDEEDSFLLAPCDPTPGIPTSSIGQCIHGLPVGVSLRMWYPCSNGILEHVIGLKFDESPTEGTYMCTANPTCLGKSYSSEIVCFTSEENYTLPVESSAAERHKMPGISLRLILWLTLLTFFFI